MATIPGRTNKPTIANATIAAGASLSDAVDLAGLSVIGLTMPAAWTAAAITVQVSYDGVTYVNLHDKAGTEYSITTAASRHVILPKADFESVRHIKLRSGTAGAAVVQVAQAVIKIVAAAL